MAHFVDIDDANGDVIDREYYCTDTCAKTSSSYGGWNGAQELDTPEICNFCEEDC